MITDPEKKCMFYESGVCDPQFNIGYTSIVTEVGMWPLLMLLVTYLWEMV